MYKLRNFTFRSQRLRDQDPFIRFQSDNSIQRCVLFSYYFCRRTGQRMSLGSYWCGFVSKFLELHVLHLKAQAKKKYKFLKEFI